MSVRVIGRIKLDPETMQKLFAERKEDFLEVQANSVKAGALHHEFLRGDGEVLVLDEWGTAEQFQQFFGGQPKIGEIMAAAGVTEPPSFEFYEVMDSPDKF
jgi:heme-degrading monooxygenase HmoA